jgi:hypothetical protein
MQPRADPASRYVVPSYLRSLRLLTQHDDEYARIEYLLRASLRSLKARILSIHAINAPQQDAIFDANHVASTVVDAWVDSRVLPEENSIHNIIHCGGRFRITDPNRGVSFCTGTIDIDDADANGQPRNESLHYEFLLCRVATGRSFVVERSNLGKHGIPVGYDSIALHQEQAVDPTLYYREYIVNDESRIYPCFVVNCVFNPAEDRVTVVPKCEACEDLPAVVYCMQDNAKLCDRCDQQLHRGNRIAERHNRVLLNEMQTTVGMTMCKEHTSMPVQYYDPVLHVPVCIQCKMTGSHSSGENSLHQLVAITDAYQSSMDDMDRERHTVDERRQTIRTQLTSIERRMALVNQNHEKCQDQLYEIVQRAVQVLHEETQSKLSALLSDEAELRRQVDYYDWMDTFLRYQQGYTNPVDFLLTFRSHSSILAKCPSEIVDGAANVRPDLIVVGNLDIAVDHTNPAVTAAYNARSGSAAALPPGAYGAPPAGGSLRQTPQPEGLQQRGILKQQQQQQQQPSFPHRQDPAAPRYSRSNSVGGGTDRGGAPSYSAAGSSSRPRYF